MDFKLFENHLFSKGKRSFREEWMFIFFYFHKVDEKWKNRVESLNNESFKRDRWKVTMWKLYEYFMQEVWFDSDKISTINLNGAMFVWLFVTLLWTEVSTCADETL